jgi:hypothetical protein
MYKLSFTNLTQLLVCSHRLVVLGGYLARLHLKTMKALSRSAGKEFVNQPSDV